MKEKKPEPVGMSGVQPSSWNIALFALPRLELVPDVMPDEAQVYARPRCGMAFVVMRVGGEEPAPPLTFHDVTRLSVNWHRSFDGARMTIRSIWGLALDEPLEPITRR